MAPGVEKAGNHALREERELSVDITQDEVRAWVLGLEKYGMDYLKVLKAFTLTDLIFNVVKYDCFQSKTIHCHHV